MYAVGKLGSYISRGVSTVSSPFQLYGGAVDIIVVEQPDGTFKSCPWYVRFGKSQGVLKAAEKVVSVNINDVEADFHMYLDNNGDAYFLREVDKEDGEWDAYPCCSGDNKKSNYEFRRMQKSKSCDYDANRADLVSELEAGEDMIEQTGSRRGRLFGLSFGRRSSKDAYSQEGDAAIIANDDNSFERAEMDADLLELGWTTNLGAGKKCDSPPQIPKRKLLVPGVTGKNCVRDVASIENSSINYHDESTVEERSSCTDGCERSSTNKEVDAEIPFFVNSGDSAEINTVEETRVGFDIASNESEISYVVDNGTTNTDINDKSKLLRVEVSEQCNGGDSLMQSEGGTKNVMSSTSFAIDECCGGSNGVVPVSAECLMEPKEELSIKRTSSEPSCTVLISEMDTKDYQIPCPGVLPSLSQITKEENTETIASCSGDDEILGNLTETENLKTGPQFSSRDLDDRKMEKVEQASVLVPDDRKKCVHGDSSINSEEITERIVTGEPHQAKDNLIQDDPVSIRSGPEFKAKRVSTQISFPKNYNDAEEEFITPKSESSPSNSLLLTGEKLGVDQPQRHFFDSDFEAMELLNNDGQVYRETIGDKQEVSSINSEIEAEIKSIMLDPAIEISLCRDLLYDGMGYEAAALAFDAKKLDKLVYGYPDIVKDANLVVRIGGLYFPWETALPIALALGSQGREPVPEAKGMIHVGLADENSEGTTTNNNMDPKHGSWKLWPFSFRKKTSSAKDTSFAYESTSRNSIGNNKNAENDETMGKDGNTEKDGSTEQDGSIKNGGNTEQDGSMDEKVNTENSGNTDVESKVSKKKIRAKIPANEQLASLNLLEGKNVVTFSITTELQGKQQVDARVFFWKWDTRIVISDVDGTITKSDLLGHVMPLMGMDWSHTGVTHLFSTIRENGYQLLFLSARSILQASITRQFLISLKQDGKALPEGPIVISPDGLFPSLYREVIRRAPHEFKISCLEDIKALFPQDHNPFYAGFGNRGTDELTYYKVGIPKGKIFTINPKGEVVINRRVDAKSYTSLHALVHDMFPETRVIEQEDYNQWNFWRVPLPDIAI